MANETPEDNLDPPKPSTFLPASTVADLTVDGWYKSRYRLIGAYQDSLKEYPNVKPGSDLAGYNK
jgi:hypothetical protein